MNIYIGEPKIITLFDTQGPCPDGFHVPLQSDMEGLMTIMSGLSFSESYGYIYSVNLKMPMCGFRRNTDGAVSSTSQGYYWTSSSNSTNSSYLYFNTVGNANISYNYRASGMSIRPFKNEFVTPVSGWTVINGTLGGAGIFWNQTDGLISITSNGSTGYTIADKNLGATVVYNNGDTLSEANCGKFYQRGNNNGFAYTGTITTSSTLINAQNYGPGNYYSGTSFICPSASPRDWSSVQNDNLRGGVSQGSSTKTEHQEVQNIYIGEYTGTVQTFDFQNNGALGWTGITIYGTPTYTSGQGWTIVTSTSQQSAIMPPSSVYNGQKLVKYKLRMYKSIASTSSKSAGCGMSASSHSNGLVCCNQLVKGVVGANVYNGSSDTFTQTTDIVGEATLEYYLNDDGSLELSINGGTKYNLGNFATLFRTDWQNNNLGICIGAWSLNSAFAFYVRKVEITTIY